MRKPAGIRWRFLKSQEGIHDVSVVAKGDPTMTLLQKCSSLLLFAFLTAFGSIALAAPTPSMPGKSTNATVTQAQPAPVDCKKHPKDPSCKKK